MSMKQPTFNGTGVALVTPFRDGKIDFESLERLIEHVIAGGVDYLVSLGTTGEAVTLNRAECLQVLRFTIKVNAGRLPIVAGLFGSNYTAKIVDVLKDFDFDGIDGILSSSPSYNKPTQEGIFQHYMQMAKHSPRPIIIYNVPGRTASNVLPETIIRLAEASSSFVAVKEASGNIPQGMELINKRPQGFSVLSGDDPTAFSLIASGGQGVISVIANAFPAQFADMCRALRNDDLATARHLNQLLYRIHHWLYVDGNPAGIKSALEILGIIQTNEVRLPLVPMQARNFRSLKLELEKVRIKDQV